MIKITICFPNPWYITPRPLSSHTKRLSWQPSSGDGDNNFEMENDLVGIQFSPFKHISGLKQNQPHTSINSNFIFKFSLRQPACVSVNANVHSFLVTYSRNGVLYSGLSFINKISSHWSPFWSSLPLCRCLEAICSLNGFSLTFDPNLSAIYTIKRVK